MVSKYIIIINKYETRCRIINTPPDHSMVTTPVPQHDNEVTIITETFTEVKNKQVCIFCFFLSWQPPYMTKVTVASKSNTVCVCVTLTERERKRCCQEALSGQLPLLPMAATARPLFPSFLSSSPTNSLSLYSLILFLFAHSLPSVVSTLSPAEVQASEFDLNGLNWSEH